MASSFEERGLRELEREKHKQEGHEREEAEQAERELSRRAEELSLEQPEFDEYFATRCSLSMRTVRAGSYSGIL